MIDVSDEHIRHVFMLSIIVVFYVPSTAMSFLETAQAPHLLSLAKDVKLAFEFLVDNIFVECGGVIFQQVIGIPMGSNCAPLLADLFLYSYEAEFI